MLKSTFRHITAYQHSTIQVPVQVGIELIMYTKKHINIDLKSGTSVRAAFIKNE